MTTVDTANAQELAAVARELGTDVLSTTGGWQLGDVDLGEYLDSYRDQRLVLIIAPVGEAEPATYTCGVCGFVMNEVGECPRCRLAEGMGNGCESREKADILDQVDDVLRGLDGRD